MSTLEAPQLLASGGLKVRVRVSVSVSVSVSVRVRISRNPNPNPNSNPNPNPNPNSNPNPNPNPNLKGELDISQRDPLWLKERGDKFYLRRDWRAAEHAYGLVLAQFSSSIMAQAIDCML